MRIPYPHSHPEFYESVTTKRFFAWLIDNIIVLGIFIITSPFTFFVSLFLFLFFYTAIDFVYRTATFSMGSAKFGMRLMAVELRHESGHRLGFYNLPFSYDWPVCFLRICFGTNSINWYDGYAR